MREFFKPWRRKVGVVMLVVACVITSGWLRSRVQNDMVTTSTGSIQQIFASNNGSLIWEQRKNASVRTRPAGFFFSITIQLSAGIEKTRFQYLSGWAEDWRRRWCGFEIGEYRSMNGDSVALLRIPHWFAAMTMTLLSAYLLLVKPRTAKKPEPAPATGP